MLNIARNIYSGWDSVHNFELPEAEIIPIGESKNEKKKLENITKKYSNLKELENIPLPGFTLFKSNKRNYGSIDQTWLIIDPRGFLVRITNDNLESILHVTGITEGLIQEKCVWAREDSQTKMILVPVSSPKYLEAVSNTELIEGKIDMKSVQIGDTVLLQNKLQGVYMGVVSMYGPVNNYSVTTEYKSQGYLRRQVIEVSPGKYHYQIDLKILKVLKKAEKLSTREESVLKMNKDIEDNISYFTSTTNMHSSYYSIYGKINHVSIHAVPKVSMYLEEIDELEATSLFLDAQAAADCGILVLENTSGKYLIDVPYIYSTRPCSIHCFDICTIKNKLELLVPFEKIILNEIRRSLYNKVIPQSYNLSQFTKFYKIVKHVKKETYI